MKNLIKESFILFAIASVAGVLLTFSYTATKPIIDENLERAKIEAMQEVFPDAVQFEEISDITLPENIESFSVGYDSSNDIIGYVLSCVTFGYGGQIDMMVGVNFDGTISNIDIIKHSETPGLGALADEDSFKSQFTGKAGPLFVVKSDSTGDNEISAITSSTITTLAVVNGSNMATDFVEKYINSGDETLAEDSSEEVVDIELTFLPTASSFDEITDFDYLEHISHLTIGYDDSNNHVGYIVHCIANGYAGEIDMTVVYNDDFTIKTLIFDDHSETPGLGALIETEAFINQFVGKTDELSVTTADTVSDNEISAITSGTVSTVAVVDTTNLATEFIKSYIGGAN